VAVSLAHGSRERDISYGGGLAHFNRLLRLAEEMLDGGDLLWGDRDGVGAEGVADEEAEICLCLRGLRAGDAEGTRVFIGPLERNVRVSMRVEIQLVLRAWGLGSERGSNEDTPSIEREDLAL